MDNQPAPMLDQWNLHLLGWGFGIFTLTSLLPSPHSCQVILMYGQGQSYSMEDI